MIIWVIHKQLKVTVAWRPCHHDHGNDCLHPLTTIIVFSTHWQCICPDSCSKRKHYKGKVPPYCKYLSFNPERWPMLLGILYIYHQSYQQSGFAKIDWMSGALRDDPHVTHWVTSWHDVNIQLKTLKIRATSTIKLYSEAWVFKYLSSTCPASSSW